MQVKIAIFSNFLFVGASREATRWKFASHEWHGWW